ncbi:MAG: SIMPL domain-containing protein [Dehalococcoidia bacterium]
MKARIWIIGAVVATLAFGAVACNGDGGGDNGDPQIRTQKGLAVAAASVNIGRANANGGGADDENLAAPGIGQVGTSDGSSVSTDIAKGGPFFPDFGFAAQQSTDGLTVVGYGSASAAADNAIIEFYFGTNGDGVVPQGVPETRSSDGSSEVSMGAPGIDDKALALQEADPITEAELQPVIDALVGAGVARDDIEFIGQSYYDPYFSSVTLRATVRDVGAVDGTVEAARNAAGGVPNVQLQSTNVSYTLEDCASLEVAAMEAAVEDAGDRSQALATVLGVGVGAVTGASNYSYSPFGGTPCDTGYIGPVPLGGVAYAEGQTNEVTVFAQIGVTYAIN